jgi:hypothetical protein
MSLMEWWGDFGHWVPGGFLKAKPETLRDQYKRSIISKTKSKSREISHP